MKVWCSRTVLLRLAVTVQLFLPCRLVVEAESTRNVVRIFVQHMQKKAEELRQQIGEQRAALNALVQNALRRGHDDEVMTLHSQVRQLARSSSVALCLTVNCEDIPFGMFIVRS